MRIDWDLVIISGALLLAFVVFMASFYAFNVALPLRMAEKGYCYQIVANSQPLRYDYYPCQAEK